MPLHFFYWNRKIILALFSLALTVIFATSVTPAHADPHAVFYTDRAQEQLFYNVLAALNQADYVEPGIPGSPYSRAQLTNNRDLTAFNQSIVNGTPDKNGQVNPVPYQSPNPVEAATHTNLPSVVTRNVTLEGNDLWTAYLYQQFARETDTRRQLSELARLYCEASLGRAGCSNQPGPAQEQSVAFPANIDQYMQQPNLSAVSLLSSDPTGGTTLTEEQELKNKLTNTKPADADAPADALNPANVTVPEGLNFIRPNSQTVAQLRNNVQSNQDAKTIVDTTAGNVIASQYAQILDPGALNKVQFTGNNKKASLPSDATFDDYIRSIRGLDSLLPGMMDIAQQGYNQGLAFQQNRAQTPSLGQYVLTKNPTGGVDGTLTTPSSAIAAEIVAGANLLPNQVIGEKIAGTSTITTPGQQPDLPVTAQTGQVLGASTSPLPSDNSVNQLSGQVAGISTQVQQLYQTYYDSPQPNPNNVTTGLIAPYKEQGTGQFAEALGIKDPNPNPQEVTCGFCTSISTIVNSATASPVVNSVYTDLFCYFFPTTEACIARKEPVSSTSPTP